MEWNFGLGNRSVLHKFELIFSQFAKRKNIKFPYNLI